MRLFGLADISPKSRNCMQNSTRRDSLLIPENSVVSYENVRCPKAMDTAVAKRGTAVLMASSFLAPNEYDPSCLASAAIHRCYFVAVWISTELLTGNWF